MNRCNTFINYLENNLEELLEFYISSSKVTSLKPKDISDFKNHIDNCKNCYQVFLQYKEIKTAIKKLPKNSLPDNLYLQISNAIYALPDKKPLNLIPEFSFKNSALAFSVVILFIFSLSLIKFNNAKKPIVQQPTISNHKLHNNNHKSKILSVPLTLKNIKKQEPLLLNNKQEAVGKQQVKIKAVKYNQREKFFKNKKHIYIARKLKTKNLKIKTPVIQENYEFALSFSAKNLNSEKNNLQIELTVEDDAYFTGENKDIKSKKIIFNSEVTDSIPQVAIIPIVSKNKTINIKGKITNNGNFVEFNKILKAPEGNYKTSNNNTNLEVLSFVPSQKENINNKNIKNMDLTISTGEVKILPVDEKNFSVISDNFGETKVVLADGESVNLDKVQVIN